MTRRRVAGALVAVLVAALGSGPVSAAPDLAELARQVEAAERAFARSMAERDFAGFSRWLSADALFFDGRAVQRGREAVALAWKPLFDGAAAPFSWSPDQVEVLGDGTLALTTGQVRDPANKLIARFNSVWRQESPGVWRVVFDKGSPPGTAERQAEPQ